MRKEHNETTSVQIGHINVTIKLCESLFPQHKFTPTFRNELSKVIKYFYKNQGKKRIYQDYENVERNVKETDILFNYSGRQKKGSKYLVSITNIENFQNLKKLVKISLSFVELEIPENAD